MMSKKSPQLRFEGFTDDWEERKLKDYVGPVISDGDWIEKEHIHDSGVYRIIQTGNLGLGEFHDKSSSAKYMNEESFNILNANEIFPNDILISRLADPAGRTIILPDTKNKMVTAVDVTIIRPNKLFDSYFFITEMNSTVVLNKISKSVSGTSHKRISRRNLELISLLIPSLEEQQKIGSFFKQLDDTIALHQRKLDLLKEQKKGFLQKMFPKNGAKVPELRFAGFADDWEERKLGDIFKKDTQKNKDLEFHSDSVISVAKMKLSPPSAKSSDEYMKTYNKIRKGNVAFEGHTNDEFPNGRFVLNDCQDGIVSHIYDVYSAVDEYNNEFMKRYINNPDVMRKILINATSSARMMKSLNSIEFLKQSILLPILSEQQKIGKFFYQLDNTITLHQRKLDLLKEQKKGFLQKMFV
ncbi:restriction endonuclease subunit S [Lactococcus petauri]|uniref:restriction endonuclease subunit S n=2 Tax=Lactococcus TaxID=1357 RepID=UPI003853E0AB